jgi:putative peptidoglycan lipid II flippase
MFKSIFTNSSGILFSRVLGFIRDFLTASILGANIYSDIFFVAFKLPNLFRRIFGEGAFSQAFIPSFTRSKYKSIFGASIFLKLLSVVFILTVVVNLFPEFITKLMAIGFSDEVIKIASPYVVINFYYLIIIFSVTYLSALLHYKEHFLTTAYSTALLNISMIFSLILANGLPPHQVIEYLSYGVVIGGILQLATHLIAIKKVNLWLIFSGGFIHFRRKKDKVKNESNKFFSKFFSAIWGNGTAQISAFVDTWLASFLVTGSISYLYYANRVFQLPLALFAIATTTAIFPRVSRFIKNKDTQSAEKMFFKAFWFLLFLLSFSMIGGIILADEIIFLLFQRGEFTVIDTKNTSEILTFYLIGLVTFGVAKLFSLWLYSTEQIKLSAEIATYSLITHLIFASLFLSNFDYIGGMGAKGLALASTLSSFVLLIFNLHYFGWHRIYKIIFSKFAIYYLIIMPIFGTTMLFLKFYLMLFFIKDKFII